MEVKVNIPEGFKDKGYIDDFKRYLKSRESGKSAALALGKGGELLDALLPQLIEILEFDSIMEDVLSGDNR